MFSPCRPLWSIAVRPNGLDSRRLLVPIDHRLQFAQGVVLRHNNLVQLLAEEGAVPSVGQMCRRTRSNEPLAVRRGVSELLTIAFAAGGLRLAALWGLHRVCRRQFTLLSLETPTLLQAPAHPPGYQRA